MATAASTKAAAATATTEPRPQRRGSALDRQLHPHRRTALAGPAGAEAAHDGIAVAESELIGLMPLAAFLDVADHAGAPADAPIEERLAIAAESIGLRDHSPMQALELRLAASASESASGST